MRKFNNHSFDNAYGHWDSEGEWARFLFLQNKQNKGEIRGLNRQVEYLLIPQQKGSKIVQLKRKTKYVDVVLERECRYKADFVYERLVGDSWELVVEDVKGIGRKGNNRKFSTETEAFKIKKKLLLYIHNIRLIIVSEPTQW